MRDVHTTLRHWLPAGLAVLALVVILGWTVAARGDDASPDLAVTTVVATSSTAPLLDSTTTAAPGTIATEVPLARTLGDGATGDDVRMVQQRLADLGFDPGVVDGIYGGATARSVWAFEKLVLGTPRDAVTGEVTPEMWSRMQDAVVVAPRRTKTTATHLEVYLPEQVAVLFVDGKVRVATHVSTGNDEEWCEEVTIDAGEYGNPGTEPIKKGVCGRSATPGGVYSFTREIDEWREGQLGRMYKPVYFNYGIAVHGSTNVPSWPASHGCVRIPMHIADYFPSLVGKGDEVFVFDGEEEPEAYGAQPPVFNWPDPDYTTTTSTTSTTTTTIAATTTKPKPPATTAAPTPAPIPPTAAPSTAALSTAPVAP